eukprot:8358005-Pyramimonas_sp.AAC.1
MWSCLPEKRPHGRALGQPGVRWAGDANVDPVFVMKIANTRNLSHLYGPSKVTHTTCNGCNRLKNLSEGSLYPADFSEVQAKAPASVHGTWICSDCEPEQGGGLSKAAAENEGAFERSLFLAIFYLACISASPKGAAGCCASQASESGKCGS